MSNQTFVKKDRISFAQNLNETIVIAPSNVTTNALFVGPNSAVTYDENSNITNIQTLQGVTLSNQYIYADGTYISNLPPGNLSDWALYRAKTNVDLSGNNIVDANIVYSGEVRTTNVLTDSIYAPNGIGNINVRNTIDMNNNIILNINTISFNDGSSQNSSANNIVQSTIVGLGTIGYISSATGLTQTNLTSTLVGLGTFGYISSTQLQSTVEGITSNISSFIDPVELSSTIIGIVTPEFISSIGFTSSIVSSLSGLGNLGYISSSQLQSTVVGLGTFGYLSTNIVPSTITGLGTFGYVSTNIVPSTIVGLGTFGYLSTNIVPSTITGLGTFGYVSSLSLQSTIRGLGTFGYLSTNIVPSTIVGLGTFGYLSTNIVPSTITGLGTFGYISSLSLQSTTIGLGTFGYLSTNIVPSTIVGLGTFGYLSTNIVPSTIVGLGTFGYLSTNIVPSTITGLGTFGYLSTNIVPSTIVGLGTFGYLSTNIVPSTIVGLGTFGYLSTNIVPSTITGLGTFGYLSTNIVPSTIVGLGTFGYVSSLSLQSTIRGLGTFGYLSTNIVPSTITGLGTFGYLSTNIIPSTITGLGTFAYLSSFNSISSFNISTRILLTNIITTQTVSTVNISSASNYTSVQFANSYNGLTLGGNINMNGGVFPTTPGNRDLGSSNARWNNFFVSTISSIHTTTSTLFVQTNIIASTINASTIGVHRLTGPDSGFNTFTNNIFPISQSATIGFGSNLSNSGYYNQGNFRSTFTNVIQPATDSVQHANVVRINGTVSTNTLATYFLQGNSPFGRFVYTDSLLPNGNVGIGNAPINTFSVVWASNLFTDTINPRFGNHPQSTVRILGTLSTGIINVSSIFAINVNASTIFASTAVVALNINVSSITGNGSNLVNLNAISSLSLQSTVVGLGAFGYVSSLSLQSTTIGLGTFGYLSTNIVPSTIVGLGTFGYVSSLSLQSTIRGLGTFGYLSTNIVPSTITGLGTFGYLSTNIVPSTITGLGTFGYLSTNIVPSTIVGLGTFGYLSSFNSISSLNISTGNLFAGTVSTFRLSASNINSDLIPSVDNTYDLGSAVSRWRDLYVAGTSIHLGDILVLSEDVNGNLSTNNGIVAKYLNVEENIECANIELKGISPVLYPTIGFNVDNIAFSVLGIGDATSVFNIWNFSGNDIRIKANTLDNTTIGDIILKGTNIKTDGLLDLSYNEIRNVSQTTNLSSATTNLLARRLSSQTPAAISVNNVSFTQVLDTTVSITYNKNPSYTTLNCTFSFRCEALTDNFSYYFTLSNSGVNEVVGVIYNPTYPYVKNFANKSNAITVQDQFDVAASNWANNATFCPLMYVKTDSTSPTLQNMKLSMVYEPILT